MQQNMLKCVGEGTKMWERCEIGGGVREGPK